MNVDILENNPTWRWYFVVAGGLIGFTIVSWLISRVLPEKWIRRVSLTSLYAPIERTNDTNYV